VHAVADVDVNMADEAGDCRMDVDGLVGLELSSEGKNLIDVAALDDGHLCRRILRSIGLRTPAAGMTANYSNRRRKG